MFPITFDDPFVPIWRDGLDEEVMAMVRTKNNWASVDVLRRGWGRTADTNPIEIIITITNSDETWSSLAKDINQHVSQRYSDVAVEVQEGSVLRFLEPEESIAPTSITARQSRSSGVMTTTPYPEQPSPGDSISMKGGPSGTLGGYVRLTWDHRPSQVVAMTCHHVVMHTSGVIEGLPIALILAFERCRLNKSSP